MASAFPTLSPTASTNRKSFFDAAGVGTIFGNALVAVYPLTERKGKARNFYVTVQQTLFEVHKSQKDAKNKKAAKYLVDFGDVFNVSVQNEPIQIKEDCVCIMDPNSSFFIRPVDSEYDVQAWFDWILERSRECRSTKLLRPVFREEYFEASWDVQIIRKPKLRRDHSKKLQQQDDLIEDLAEKRPQMLGHRRLCICPSSFLIFTIGCRPNSSVDMPFEKHHYIDLSLNVISNYGTQERYFFIRIGRCSEIGSGELWMATEHGASAKAMHERISQINQRESERRRAQGIKINLPTISSSVLKSRAHRERSQTQNMHKKQRSAKAEGEAVAAEQQQQPETESRKVSTNSGRDEQQNGGRRQHHASNGSLSLSSQLTSGRVDSVNCLQSIPEQLLLSEQPTGSESKKNSLVNLLTSRIGSKMSSGSVGKEKHKPPPVAPLKMDQLTAPPSPSAQSSAVNFELNGKEMLKGSNASLNLAASSLQSARNSLVSSVFGLRLTRRNSITNGKNAAVSSASAQKQQTIPKTAASFSAQPSYDCAEDYMTYDADDRQQNSGGASHSLKLGSVNSRMSASGLTRAGSRKSNSSYSGAPIRQFSTSSGVYMTSPDPHSGPSTTAKGGQQHHNNNNQLANMPGDYLEMNVDQGGGSGAGGSRTTAEPMFALHEVQSYISNSSESCWTPGSSNTNKSNENAVGANAPRAYSLGSKPAAGANQDSPESSRPGSSEVNRMQTIHSQLLHPCASSSPPNYLKKSILINQTAKHIRNKEAEASKKSQQEMGKERTKEEEKEAAIVEDQELNDLSAEVRKRAHSVGSKTWVKPSLRKFSTAAAIKKKEEDSSAAPSEGDDNSRRNTYGAKSMGSGSTFYPHSMEDHVEIDFDRDESPSIDSIPSLNSRNSSLGKQIPLGIRTALDSLAHSRGFSASEKPSEKLIHSKGRDSGAAHQMRRKRSVPEMLQHIHQMATIQNATTGASSPNNFADQQHYLHPNRRSTYDSSIRKHVKIEKREVVQHKSPPRTLTMAGQIPSSQSTSSGISSRSTATDTSIKEVKTIAEDEDDDYMLLSTPQNQSSRSNPQQQQQQLTVRSIGTILESSSPCSSISSDGESKRRGRLTSREKASTSSTSDFPDDYSAMIIPNPKRSSQSPAKQTPAAATVSGPVRARLSVSSRSRSPSLSPQPRRKFSAQQPQCSPSPVRSYFPVHRDSPSPIRRKTSAASFTRELISSGADAKAMRKFTCPNLATEAYSSRQKQQQRMGSKQKQEQQQECDYALISEQGH